MSQDVLVLQYFSELSPQTVLHYMIPICQLEQERKAVSCFYCLAPHREESLNIFPNEWEGGGQMPRRPVGVVGLVG